MHEGSVIKKSLVHFAIFRFFYFYTKTLDKQLNICLNVYNKMIET